MTVNHDVVGSSPTGGVKKTVTTVEAVVFFSYFISTFVTMTKMSWSFCAFLFIMGLPFK